MLSQWQENKDKILLEKTKNNPSAEDYYMELSDRADDLIARIRQHNKKTHLGGQRRWKDTK